MIIEHTKDGRPHFHLLFGEHGSENINDLQQLVFSTWDKSYVTNNLLEVAAWMDAVDELPRAELKGINFNNHCPDLSDVKGQEQAKRALIIAAAGKHNLLISCPIE